MQLVKELPLGGGYRNSFLEKWEMVSFSEMGKILSLDKKEEGSGLHIVV